MTNSQRLAKVRQRLIGWLATNGEADTRADGPSDQDTAAADPIERESILIRDEFFCGRRFYTASHQAVWFIEEDELKIYQNDGELVCTLQGSQIDDLSTADQPDSGPDILRLPAADDSSAAADADRDSEPPVRRAA